jgi:broad specificity phosphatase PhoE
MTGRIAALAHAATSAQRSLRFPLDEAIEPPAAGTNECVVAALPRYEQAWHGPERRAVETVETLGVVAQPEPALRACSMGTWSGIGVAEIAERQPGAFEAWRRDPAASPPDGESLIAFTNRVGSWLDRDETAAAKTLVVVDPSVIRALIVCALCLGPDAFWRFDIAPLSLTVLQHHEGFWRARTIGAVLRP